MNEHSKSANKVDGRVGKCRFATAVVLHCEVLLVENTAVGREMLVPTSRGECRAITYNS